MTDLHVIYRVDDEGTPDELWATYSFPEGIYVSAPVSLAGRAFRAENECFRSRCGGATIGVVAR